MFFSELNRTPTNVGVFSNYLDARNEFKQGEKKYTFVVVAPEETLTWRITRLRESTSHPAILPVVERRILSANVSDEGSSRKRTYVRTTV